MTDETTGTTPTPTTTPAIAPLTDDEREALALILEGARRLGAGTAALYAIGAAARLLGPGRAGLPAALRALRGDLGPSLGRLAAPALRTLLEHLGPPAGGREGPGDGAAG